MTNEELDQIKVELRTITLNVHQLVTNMNALGQKLDEIDSNEDYAKFQEAAVVYSQAKNQLTAYLLRAVDSLGLTLLDVIKYIQSTPKAKLWLPETVR